MKTILVVDDSFIIRKQVGTALVAAGFEVIEAADGAEALARLAKSPDISLVFTDVNMPKMSGIDFLEAVRADERLAKTPIVMLTTEGQTALIQRAKELGALGWLKKPFNAQLVVATATKLAAA